MVGSRPDYERSHRRYYDDLLLDDRQRMKMLGTAQARLRVDPRLYTWTELRELSAELLDEFDLSEWMRKGASVEDHLGPLAVIECCDPPEIERTMTQFDEDLRHLCDAARAIAGIDSKVAIAATTAWSHNHWLRTCPFARANLWCAQLRAFNIARHLNVHVGTQPVGEDDPPSDYDIFSPYNLAVDAGVETASDDVASWTPLYATRLEHRYGRRFCEDRDEALLRWFLSRLKNERRD